MAELHALTKLPRIGWVLAGVANPESVSDHCFETAIIAYILAQQIDEPVELGKVLTMALFHEVGEVRLTDLPRRSSPYVREFKRKAEREAAVDILGDLAGEVLPLLDELHELKTLEARLVEAAEELQIIAAAMYYAKENQGDISEYRRDVARYDALGIVPAALVAEVVARRLGEYLGDRPYWELGYRRENQPPAKE
ncbi:HD domain-containing protein [Sphaerisporangium corydalis]|uniref:5'-deoxynucleotidase n=1 Tax=Sphaerisporangium corydalis TaxID=1441875 RepID=A0ABV9ES38_9ACTN|nr:HD domain-containing protein [Sphaerisporangium corydalis]